MYVLCIKKSKKQGFENIHHKKKRKNEDDRAYGKSPCIIYVCLLPPRTGIIYSYR